MGMTVTELEDRMTGREMLLFAAEQTLTSREQERARQQASKGRGRL